jgi:hypothetical protein
MEVVQKMNKREIPEHNLPTVLNGKSTKGGTRKSGNKTKPGLIQVATAKSPNPNFWESQALDELAEAQGVHAIKDISDLYGTWPGEPDDGFEELIHSIRQRSSCEGKSR